MTIGSGETADRGGWDSSSPRDRLAATEFLLQERGVDPGTFDPSEDELADAAARMRAQQAAADARAAAEPPAPPPAAEPPAAEAAPVAALSATPTGGAEPPPAKPPVSIFEEGRAPNGRMRPMRLLAIALGAGALALGVGQYFHSANTLDPAPTAAVLNGTVGALPSRAAAPEAFAEAAVRAAAAKGMSAAATQDALLAHLSADAKARAAGNAAPTASALGATGLRFVSSHEGSGQTVLMDGGKQLARVDWGAAAGPAAASGLDAAPVLDSDALWTRSALLFAWRGVEVDGIKNLRSFAEGEAQKLQRYQERSARDPAGARADNRYVEPSLPYCSVSTGAPLPGIAAEGYPQVVYSMQPGRGMQTQLRVFDAASGESRIVAQTERAGVQTAALANRDECAVQSRRQARVFMQGIGRR